MTVIAPLKTLLQLCQHASYKATPYDKIILDALEKGDVKGSFVDEILPISDIRADLNPWSLIDKWQKMLSIMLTLLEHNELHSHTLQLTERMRALNSCFIWQEFQLVCIYQAICAHLLGKPYQKPVIRQNLKGAAPTEYGGHWSWGNVPHSHFHSELGFLWFLYGQLTDDPSYFEAASSLAHWQLNVLNHNYLPFVGLFSQEMDFSEIALLVNNFLLFNAVSSFTNHKEMAGVAEKQFDRIASLLPNTAVNFSFLHLSCDKWLSKYRGDAPSNLPTLSNIFKDEQLRLVGYRAPSNSAVSTIAGGGSSMGCLCREDVQLVNFGPQHLPLGDCRGFGIESFPGNLAESEFKITTSDHSYSIEGIARLSPLPKKFDVNNGFSCAEPGGFWIESKQTFQSGQLIIDAIFRGLHDINNLAFVFFIKAKSCVIEDSDTVNLRSFKRYQGEIKNIILQGEEGALTIKAGQNQGEMQVIPLGGGNNFWGADFLVSYLLVSQENKYRWVIN